MLVFQKVLVLIILWYRNFVSFKFFANKNFIIIAGISIITLCDSWNNFNSLNLNVEKIYYSKVGVGPKIMDFQKISESDFDFNNELLSHIPAIAGTKIDCKML